MSARQRETAGVSYSCERTYDLDYNGFPSSRQAQIRAQVEHHGSAVAITVVSESGSAVLRNHVLQRMIGAERDASTGPEHEESRLSLQNYSFTLEGKEESAHGPVYVLLIKPHMKSKIAWSGRVWVDGANYSVIRAEGQPEKMPSWWTVHSEFTATYQNLNGVWVPERNVSDTKVRFGGHAHLEIDNTNCHSMGGPAPSRSADAR